MRGCVWPAPLAHVVSTQENVCTLLQPLTILLHVVIWVIISVPGCHLCGAQTEASVSLSPRCPSGSRFPAPPACNLSSREGTPEKVVAEVPTGIPLHFVLL